MAALLRERRLSWYGKLFAARPVMPVVCIREIYHILSRIGYVDIIDLTIPTFYRPAFRILKRYAGKVDAIGERTHSNAGDAVRNRDACKIAILERPLPDPCDAAGDRDACKIEAKGESTVFNACDAVRERDACDLPAIRECILPNACDALGNCDFSLDCPWNVDDPRLCLIV